MKRIFIWLTNWRRGTTNVFTVKDELEGKEKIDTSYRNETYLIREENGKKYLYRLKATTEGCFVSELLGPCGSNLEDELESRGLLATA